jgi:tRNA-specific 2-thiouridylase
MSGGVDSSVAAALLLREGYEVMGAFMRLGSPKGVEQEEKLQAACDTSGKSKQGCCSVLDAVDARRVAGMLGIPFYVLNFEQDFGRVIDYFVSEYNRGRTPNHCVRCNDWLKFGKLAQYAQAVGADFVASGHYARIGIDPVTNEKSLMRGLDHKKDQSYVLFGMSRWAMEHTLLPIGGYEKHDVRKIAEELNLPVFNKPDSQEICFVPNQDYAGLVRRRSPETFREGELVGTDGKNVGTHAGHQHFTIGQRKGVGVAFGRPIYVVDINAENNRVTVGEKEDLLRSTLMASQINLLSLRLSVNSGPVRCSAKIRYNHAPQSALAEVIGDQLRVTFDEPQTAITPGQAVVVYDNDVLLGGGWID